MTLAFRSQSCDRERSRRRTSKARFDVLLFPNQSKDVLLEGRQKWRGEYSQPSYPPEFSKPISKDGMKKIASWIDGGGVVVSWGRSTALFLDTLEIVPDDGEGDPEVVRLPVRDLSEELETKGLLVPGAFLAVDYLADHPLTWGMPQHSGVFSRGAPVFATSIPVFDMDRRVIATHPRTRSCSAATPSMPSCSRRSR